MMFEVEAAKEVGVIEGIRRKLCEKNSSVQFFIKKIL